MNAQEKADPLDQLKRDCGYAEVPEDGDDGGIDALIDYKNALEDRCRDLEGTLAPPVLVKCGSHRARRKLFALVGKENTEALFSLWRNIGNGGAFRIPAEFEAEAKAITGVSGLRDGDDLHKCWETI